MRYAVINQASGLVANIVEIEDLEGSKPDEGFAFVASDVADLGDRWDGRVIIPGPREQDTRPKPSADELRKSAYITESDPLVIKAMRLQLAGDAGFETARVAALDAVAAIKRRYPEGK